MMNTIIKANILAQLTAMFPSEFEEWRERGEADRHALTTAVMQQLMTPEGWTVNGEYRSEFGGLFPVQLRYTPPGAPFSLCICSPGEFSPAWIAALVSADGEFVRVLLAAEKFSPVRFNALLEAVGQVCRMEYTVQGAAAYLAEEVMA
ncbi:MAG: conjugation system SOS inhibitor PsiB [Pantoea sp.]|uniref:conjugation system SOS inhibitor PsiB n=1 Tax=Pantoea sp. TaxID=69393 RepID=UPI002383E549|nr:conjugation system SOS inhibitor PsiB [Pantoea sp.]MDE1188861.1 conjugation system SOS inhibitor PsiB [Pantoea sp.]